MVPAKAIGVLFYAAAERNYFYCASRHVIGYLSIMVGHFCLFKVLAVPPKRRVAVPAWVIRVALRRPHFLVQRVAAPPDWACCGAP